MISVIEDFPSIRLNFNLTPVLVLQIKELIEGRIRDRWLDWARTPAADLDEETKFALLENFFKIHWENLVKPFPRYWELLNKRGLTFYRDDARRGLRYFSNQEFTDLQTWFNLAWCGYAAGGLYPELNELKLKGRNFTEEEKQRVLDIHVEIMGLVLRKYRAAEERGRGLRAPFSIPFCHSSRYLLRRAQPAGTGFPRRFSWPGCAAQLTTRGRAAPGLPGAPARGMAERV
jgi:alpha-amylase/alpha-mannosidase (GH57 family)